MVSIYLITMSFFGRDLTRKTTISGGIFLHLPQGPEVPDKVKASSFKQVRREGNFLQAMGIIGWVSNK